MPCTCAAFDGLSAEIKHKDNTYSRAAGGLELAGAELAEQAAQEPREHHRRAVIAAAAFCSPLCVFERLC